MTIHELSTTPRPALPPHLVNVCPATHRRVVAAMEAADEARLAGEDLLEAKLIAAARAEVEAVLGRIAA